MRKKFNTHRNRQLSPFNRGWYNPKNVHSQVNGQTELSQDMIILKNDVVTKHKK